MQDDYEEYENSLQVVNLQYLFDRSLTLCENLTIITSKHEHLYSMFPENVIDPERKTRINENIKLIWRRRALQKFFSSIHAKIAELKLQEGMIWNNTLRKT